MKKFTILSLISLALLTISPLAAAQDADPAKGLYLPGDVTADLARIAVDAAIKKAQEQGTLMNIAIVDAGGNLKAFHRMDGAFLASIEISIKKAQTARSLNMSTTQLHDAAVPGAELYGIEVTNGGMVIFGGGELLKDKSGTIVGAIGVSGSSVANDVTVAKAGAAAVLAASK
ncbi:MAG: heme-binding protein [Betaproteobacteria bacterium]|nr:heme-binding protein [Betaproteobacteria bacterium]